MDFNNIYLQNLYIENLDPECKTGELNFVWDRDPDNSFAMNLYANTKNRKDDENRQYLRDIFLINVNFDPHGPFTSDSDTREGILKSLCEYILLFPLAIHVKYNEVPKRQCSAA